MMSGAWRYAWIAALALLACGDPTDPGAVNELRIVFARGAVPYTMRPDGTDRRQLLPQVDSGPNGPLPWRLPDVNAVGDRIAFEVDGDIRVITPDGTSLSLVMSDGFTIPELWPSWSPDGERLAFSNNAYLHQDIFTMDIHGGNRVQLTNDPADDLEPAWAPDGTRIAFSSDRDSTFGIFTLTPSGGGLTRVTPYSVVAYAPAWDPAGDEIAFFGYDSTGSGMFIVGADGGGLRKVVSIFTYGRASWSPDGRQLAFSATTGGQSKIFVVNRDGSDLKVITPPNDADYDPAWVKPGD